MFWRRRWIVSVESMDVKPPSFYGPFWSRRRAQLWADEHIGPVNLPSWSAVVAQLRKP